jgi:hypothetical protein
MVLDKTERQRLVQSIIEFLEKAEPLDYLYFVLKNIAIDDALIDMLPTIKNMLRSGGWVIVAGDKSCILSFLETTVLDGKRVFVYNMPFIAFTVIKRDIIDRKKLNKWLDAKIDEYEWRETQYIIMKKHGHVCMAMMGDTLFYGFGRELTIINAIENMRKIIERTKIIDINTSIDNVIIDVTEKLRSDDWLVVIGPSLFVGQIAYVSLLLCNTAPTIYIYMPTYTSVALVNKCKEFYELHNASETAEKLTEEGFKRLKAKILIDKYVDSEGHSHIEGLNYYDNESINDIIEIIKKLYLESKNERKIHHEHQSNNNQSSD